MIPTTSSRPRDVIRKTCEVNSWQVGWYVQINRTGAECPLVAGGVYRIEEVDGKGHLHFKQCGQAHNPEAHGCVLIPKPCRAQFKVGDLAMSREDRCVLDHACTLEAHRRYRVDAVDDFQRLWFSLSCRVWHDSEDFELVDPSARETEQKR